MASLTFAAAPAKAEGALTSVAHFFNGQSKLDLDVYVEDGKRVGLVSVVQSGDDKWLSLAYDSDAADQVTNLWTQARAGLGGSGWREVGSYSEVGTKDVTHMMLSTGPTVRVILSSAEKGGRTFDVAPGDTAEMDRDLQRMRTFLAGGGL
jgi:hypothetical protein